MKKEGQSKVCEEKIYAKLFEEHADDLFKYLSFRYGNTELGYDAMQEAFVKLWQNCKKIPLKNAKSYLYTVAKNKTIDYFRGQKNVLKIKEGVELMSSTESPESIMITSELKVQMKKIIENMPETLRVPFLLNRIEGKKYVEIADMLGLSVKAIEKRMSKALKYIKENKEKLDLR